MKSRPMLYLALACGFAMVVLLAGACSPKRLARSNIATTALATVGPPHETVRVATQRGAAVRFLDTLEVVSEESPQNPFQKLERLVSTHDGVTLEIAPGTCDAFSTATCYLLATTEQPFTKYMATLDGFAPDGRHFIGKRRRPGNPDDVVVWDIPVKSAVVIALAPETTLLSVQYVPDDNAAWLQTGREWVQVSMDGSILQTALVAPSMPPQPVVEPSVPATIPASEAVRCPAIQRMIEVDRGTVTLISFPSLENPETISLDPPLVLAAEPGGVVSAFFTSTCSHVVINTRFDVFLASVQTKEIGYLFPGQASPMAPPRQR